MRFFAFMVGLLFGLIGQVSYAMHWPRFVAPSKAFLIENHLVQSGGCPMGQGKLRSGLVININQSLCRTNYCPPDWVWVAVGGECKDLLTDFNLKQTHILHIDNDDGAVNRSVITADYGTLNASKASFSFVMSTEAGIGWYCVEEEPGTLTCANDQ